MQVSSTVENIFSQKLKLDYENIQLQGFSYMCVVFVCLFVCFLFFAGGLFNTVFLKKFKVL